MSLKSVLWSLFHSGIINQCVIRPPICWFVGTGRSGLAVRESMKGRALTVGLRGPSICSYLVPNMELSLTFWGFQLWMFIVLNFQFLLKACTRQPSYRIPNMELQGTEYGIITSKSPSL